MLNRANSTPGRTVLASACKHLRGLACLDSFAGPSHVRIRPIGYDLRLSPVCVRDHPVDADPLGAMPGNGSLSVQWSFGHIPCAVTNTGSLRKPEWLLGLSGLLSRSRRLLGLLSRSGLYLDSRNLLCLGSRSSRGDCGAGLLTGLFGFLARHVRSPFTTSLGRVIHIVILLAHRYRSNEEVWKSSGAGGSPTASMGATDGFYTDGWSVIFADGNKAGRMDGSVHEQKIKKYAVEQAVLQWAI